jgi:hypothetical protein
MHDNPAVLASLGLRRGEPVRFKRLPTASWAAGVLHGVEPDGHLARTDASGTTRSIPAERVEVRRPQHGRRARWCPVTEVATTWEQLAFW